MGLVLLTLGAVTPRGQGPDQAQPRFVGPPATAVLVDVVVRDRQGGLVTDLGADGIEVLEDGVRQTVVLFDAPHSRRAPATLGEPGMPTSRPRSSAPTGAPHLVALVFEELGAQARVAAHKAARVYLEEQRGPDEFVGVFAVDKALHGLRTAAMRPGCPQFFEGDVAPAEGAGGECTEGIPGRHRAIATLDALTALIDGGHLVPGRKSVLLFSEGIRLESESDVMDRLNATIDRANRSGVSFYTVDAAGLRARSPSAGPRKTLRAFTAETPGVSVSPDSVMFGEPYLALSRLAKETGGAFLDNTNALERAARRMGEDLRSYYLLGYVPTNSALDGSYRRIAVRVKRRDVRVQARAGYLALPRRQTLAPHDVAPLLMLEQATRPRDFRFQVDVDTSARPVRVRADVEHQVLRYVPNAAATSCQARLTVLARAVDKDGRTLWASSDAFELTTPLAQCVAGGGRSSHFERDVVLPPTAARLEVVAYDMLADRGSVRDFDVPPAK